MDRIYQVFVSSTFVDLQEERKEVMQALLELDCMPAGMELFPASNDDQWTLIKRVIDACDYYLLIIGGRYGSTNEKGISYTQMEFEHALNTGKPIISFLPKNPENIPTGKCEKDPENQKKLEEFKKLAQKKLVKYWDSPEQLGSIVSRSMIKLIKDFPADGWVRAGNAVDEKSVKEIARLQKENLELKNQLDLIATEAPKGTEILAQGEDTIDVLYSFQAWNRNQGKYVTFSQSIECTWNELFSVVAPLLINEGHEEQMRDALTMLVVRKSSDLIQKAKNKGLSNFNNFRIDQSSYGTIKVQFRALGLISLGQKKRAVTDKETYWQLTPYGDNVMMQLLAIRK